MGWLAVVLLILLLAAGVVVVVLAVQYVKLPWVEPRWRVLAAVRPLRRLVADIERSSTRIARLRERASSSRDEGLADADLDRLRHVYAFAAAWSRALEAYEGDLRRYGFLWFAWRKAKQETSIPTPQFPPAPSQDEFEAVTRFVAEHGGGDAVPERHGVLGAILDGLRFRRPAHAKTASERPSAPPGWTAASSLPDEDVSPPTPAAAPSASDLRAARESWLARVHDALKAFSPEAEAVQAGARGDAMRVDVNVYANAIHRACRTISEDGGPDALKEARRTIGMRSRVLAQFAAYYTGTSPALAARWRELSSAIADEPRN